MAEELNADEVVRSRLEEAGRKAMQAEMEAIKKEAEDSRIAGLKRQYIQAMRALPRGNFNRANELRAHYRSLGVPVDSMRIEDFQNG